MCLLAIVRFIKMQAQFLVADASGQDLQTILARIVQMIFVMCAAPVEEP